jgi:formate hydrogenlyase subunit 6/NADH:ubiquinone oxidoreductase subunit I
MPWKKLAKSDLPAFLAELSTRAELLVPQEKSGKVRFLPFDAAQPVNFPSSLVDVSLKSVFFPKRRPVATFDPADRTKLEPAAPETSPRILLGAHPCDVAAVNYVDRVFIHSSFKDPLYEAERNRTTIIGMACSEMKPECHCTDRDLSPDDERGMDAVFYETSDAYLFRALNDKGAAILKSSLLKETSEEPQKKDWPGGKYPVDPSSLPSADDSLLSPPSSLFQDIADLCLTCGACTFACPTCTCFLISDEQHEGRGERVTAWDSCQFSGYSRMTGGHNPRKTRAARVRNRMLDKFVYTVEKYGATSCVGCGRCAIICPVGRHFPKEIAELSAKAKGR